jgi:hypothetical protein
VTEPRTEYRSKKAKKANWGDTHKADIKNLLRLAKAQLPQLKQTLAEASSHWGYEDPIYRFYHHSFKVYEVQKLTQKILEDLKALAPNLPMNQIFLKIITEGTNKNFEISHNEDWLQHTRPIVEAFFHARHMLEMICKYAELKMGLLGRGLRPR